MEKQEMEIEDKRKQFCYQVRIRLQLAIQKPFCERL